MSKVNGGNEKRVDVVALLGGRDWLRAAGLKVDPAGQGIQNGAAFVVAKDDAARPNRAVVSQLPKSLAYRVAFWRVDGDDAEQLNDVTAATIASVKAALVKRLGLVIDPVFLPLAFPATEIIPPPPVAA